MNPSLRHWPVEAGLVAQWTHPVLRTEGYISPWTAMDDAAELARDVWFPIIRVQATPISHPSCLRSPTTSIRSDKRLRFDDTLELFLGAESSSSMMQLKMPASTLDDWHDKPWRIGSTTFSEDLSDDADVVSLLAHQGLQGLPRLPHLLPPNLPTDNIVDDRRAAAEPMDEDDPAFDPEYEDDSEDMRDDSSTSSDRRRGRFWQTVRAFKLGGYATQYRVRWDAYQALHSGVCGAEGLDLGDLTSIYEVHTPPHDFADAGVVPIILHRVGDLRDGDHFQFVLVDVKFHDPWPATSIEVVRGVKLLPSWVHKINLIAMLGLEPYCKSVKQRCLLWLNHKYVSTPWTAHMNLRHGDYLQLHVPPVADDCQAPTRAAAVMARQGVLPRDFRQRWTEVRDDRDAFVDHMPVRRVRLETYDYESDDDSMSTIQVVASRQHAVSHESFQLPITKTCHIGFDDAMDPWDLEADADNPTIVHVLDHLPKMRPIDGHDDNIVIHGMDDLRRIWNANATEAPHPDQRSLHFTTWYLSGMTDQVCTASRTPVGYGTDNAK